MPGGDPDEMVLVVADAYKGLLMVRGSSSGSSRGGSSRGGGIRGCSWCAVVAVVAVVVVGVIMIGAVVQRAAHGEQQ